MCPALDELTIRIYDRIDVVVDDVVGSEVVFVVRRTADRQRGRRGVQRDGAFARAVEQRDVLGVASAA
jgi:hypothetical protein